MVSYVGANQFDGLSEEERFWSKVEKTERCWLWIGGKNAMGYGTLRFRGKAFLAHRASWILNGGELIPDICVLHTICDNPPCVNPAHLKLGSRAENNREAIEKKRARYMSGEKHAHKLTWREVDEIRTLFDKGFSKARIAKEFAVTDVLVGLIVREKIWKKVSREKED